MRWMTMSILSALMVTASCGKKSSSDDSGAFAWDSSKRECRNGSAAGFNEGVIGDCGMIRDRDLSGQDFKGKTFRGAYFVDVRADNADFTGVDFTGSRFTRASFQAAKLTSADLSYTRLENSNFNRSDLRNASLYSENKRQVAAIISTTFKGAKINSRTTMKSYLNDALALGFEMDEGSGSGLTLSEFGSNITTGTPSGPLSVGLQSRVYADMRELKNLKIKSTDARFNQIFGGGDADAVVRYMNERVKYIYYDTSDKISQETGVNAYNVDVNWWRSIYNDYLTAKGIGSGTPATIFSVKVNGKEVKLDGPRRGLMGIGMGYMDMRNNPMIRLGTLVHEARHSDCTALPPFEDVKGFLYQDNYDVKTPTCNHHHVNCPAGHDLEGKPACDNHAWGAYSVAMVFGETVYHDCAECSEEDKQSALAKAMDSKTRVLVLDSMLNGSLGSPNMNSLK